MSGSSGEAAFRIACVVFAVFLAFIGVFRSAHLQLLWGWGLALGIPALVVLCIFVLRGLTLVLGLLAMATAAIGAYLLLIDSSVRGHREGLRRR